MDLAAAIARWRETRDPALGTIVVETGVRAPVDPALAAIAALPSRDQPDALIAALGAAGPAALSPLIGAIDQFARTKRGSWPVIELVVDREPDPRFAAFAISLLADFAELPHTSAKLWRRLVDIIEHHGDRGDGGALSRLALPMGTPDQARARIRNVVKRLLARGTALPADEVAAWRTALAGLRADSIVAPVTAGPTDGDALLAAIRADPDDLGARAVYADWLVARDDPRGEFITLQLQRTAGTLTEAGAKRETALLKKHHRAWLEPLTSLLVDGWHPPNDKPPIDPRALAVPVERLARTMFANGFVAHLQAISVPKHRLAVLDDPIFATVTHARGLPRFTAAMRALRAALDITAPDAFATLPALRQPLAVLDCDRVAGEQLEQMRGIAQVVLGSTSGPRWPTLVRGNLVIEQLRALGGLLPRWPDGLDLVAFATAPRLRELCLATAYDEARLTLTRADAGGFVRGLLTTRGSTWPELARLAPLATLGPGGGRVPHVRIEARTDADDRARTLRDQLRAIVGEVELAVVFA